MAKTYLIPRLEISIESIDDKDSILLLNYSDGKKYVVKYFPIGDDIYESIGATNRYAYALARAHDIPEAVRLIAHSPLERVIIMEYIHEPFLRTLYKQGYHLSDEVLIAYIDLIKIFYDHRIELDTAAANTALDVATGKLKLIDFMLRDEDSDEISGLALNLYITDDLFEPGKEGSLERIIRLLPLTSLASRAEEIIQAIRKLSRVT